MSTFKAPACSEPMPGSFFVLFPAAVSRPSTIRQNRVFPLDAGLVLPIFRGMDPTLLVCVNRRFGTAPSCAERGGVELLEALKEEAARRGLPWEVEAQVCLGYCALGPNLKAAPGGPMLHGCGAGQAAEILDRLERDWRRGEAGTRPSPPVPPAPGS